MRGPYFWLFTLCTVVYILGLVLPVMDVDSAQYAGISREMAETGNYLQIKYMGNDYLDKPPLLFWVSAFFFELFGVQDWAFKIGSFLFTLIGVFSTFRLGKLLYDEKTGKLAALMLYSCQAFFIFNNDIRTDTILTGAVIFSIWQLAEWLNNRRWLWMIGAGIGIGLAMLAKGPIGLMVPVLAIVGYIIGRQSWRDFLRWQYLVLLLIVAVILAPMLWGLYQQFDMHPEKVTPMVSPDGLQSVEGISGVRFYLWTQSFGRLTGENVWSNDSGPFFFVHNFLWSFLPWALLFILALITRLRQIALDIRWSGRTPELLTTLGFLLPFVALSMSAYKLPHYIFVLYPLAAVLLAWWWNDKVFGKRIIKPWLVTTLIFQIMIALGSIAVLLFIFFRFFPGAPIYILLINALLVIGAFWFFFNYRKQRMNIIFGSVIISIAVNFSMNTWFYPNLLKYQAGSGIAKIIEEKNIPPGEVFMLDYFSFSLSYYSRGKTTVSTWEEAVKMLDNDEQVYFVTNDTGLEKLEAFGNAEIMGKVDSYAITLLSVTFLNPETRKSRLKPIYLIKIKNREMG